METMYDNTKKSYLSNTTKEKEINYYYEPTIKTARNPLIHNELGIEIGAAVTTTYKICTNDCISKTKLISFLEDKIKEYKKIQKNLYEKENIKLVEKAKINSYIGAYQEDLDFVRGDN